MLKKLLVLFFTSLLVFLPSMLAFAQEAPAQNKTAKEVRWEGTVIRSDPDKSTLTVRKVSHDHVQGTLGDGKGRLSVETGSGNVYLEKL